MPNNVTFSFYIPNASRPSGSVAFPEIPAPPQRDERINVLFKRSRDSGSAFTLLSDKSAEPPAKRIPASDLFLAGRVPRKHREERQVLLFKHLSKNPTPKTVKQIFDSLPKKEWTDGGIRNTLRMLEKAGKVSRKKESEDRADQSHFWFPVLEESTS